MKAENNRIFTSGIASITDQVEQEFFRIERENRWLSAAINGAIAGSAVAIVAWLIQSFREGDLLLFACLGSSAAAVVFAPVSKNNSLRTIMLAYLIASIVCLVMYPVRHHDNLAVQCYLAVGVSIFFMRLFDAMHPAAIGSAMAFLIDERDLDSLFNLMLAIVGLLTVVKVLAYIYLEDLTFKNFMLEFQREYYGQEMTITVMAGIGMESSPEVVSEAANEEPAE